MDDGYGTCEWCGWSGRLRADGTMRRHRPQRDSGRTGASGSLPQDLHADYCKGSLTTPYKPSINH